MVMADTLQNAHFLHKLDELIALCFNYGID
jgi:hypothetical protein